MAEQPQQRSCESIDVEKSLHDEGLVMELEKVQVAEPDETKKVDAVVEKTEAKKPGLLETLHRSHSSSSNSSSDHEEEAAAGENKGERKKKGLMEKIKEKKSGKKKDGEEEEKKTKQEVVTTTATPATTDKEDDTVPVEMLNETAPQAESEAQEKKGFLKKIKEKLPGGGVQQKEPAEEGGANQLGKEREGDRAQSPKEKKGILGKIMDKIPGYNSKNNGAGESGVGH